MSPYSSYFVLTTPSHNHLPSLLKRHFQNKLQGVNLLNFRLSQTNLDKLRDGFVCTGTRGTHIAGLGNLGATGNLDKDLMDIGHTMCHHVAAGEWSRGVGGQDRPAAWVPRFCGDTESDWRILGEGRGSETTKDMGSRIVLGAFT